MSASRRTIMTIGALSAITGVSLDDFVNERFPPEDQPIRTVHWSDWADQPSVRIACDQTYDTPAFNSVDETENVYEREDGKLYTFQSALATCPGCLEAIAEAKKKHGADFCG